MTTTLVPRKLKKSKTAKVQLPCGHEIVGTIPEPPTESEVSNIKPLTAINGVIHEIPLGDISVHKHNRKITDDSVTELSQSITEFGQLEPATVRAIGMTRKYELISGERRYRACKLAKIATLRCIIVDESQSDGLVRLAAANSNREDLNPIDRAKLMVQLMKPIAAGGSGLSRIDAGKSVGLMSESGAKNALRFLKLPESLQDMIRSGKLSERAARRLIPFADIKAVMDEVALDLNSKVSELLYELTTEDGFPWNLKQIIEDNTRPMDKREFGSNRLIKNRWTRQPKLFDGDGGLAVREIQVDNEKWLITTDVDKWDALQIPLLVQKCEKDAGRGAKIKPKSTKVDAKAKTPAEIQKEAAAKRKAANDRLNMWTNGTWVPCALRLQMAMNPPKDVSLLLPHLIANFNGHFREILEATYIECEIATSKGDMCPLNGENEVHLQAGLWRLLLWPVSARLETKGIKDKMARQPIVLPMDCIPELDRLTNTLSRDRTRKLAERCETNILLFWEAARKNRQQRNLLREWIDRHTTDQLKDLWSELKIKAVPPAKHSELVDVFMNEHEADKYPLPKRLVTVKR